MASNPERKKDPSVSIRPQRRKRKRNGIEQRAREMLTYSSHGINPLARSRYTPGPGSAKQRLSRCFALGPPCPKREARINQRFPSDRGVLFQCGQQRPTAVVVLVGFRHADVRVDQPGVPHPMARVKR